MQRKQQVGEWDASFPLSSTVDIYFGNMGFGTSGILSSHIHLSSEEVIPKEQDLMPRVFEFNSGDLLQKSEI
jgi:hypothetical protein